MKKKLRVFKNRLEALIKEHTNNPVKFEKKIEKDVNK
jgi:hypothetical protein